MTTLRATYSKKINSNGSCSTNCQTQFASLPPEILVVEDGSGLFTKIGALLQDWGFQVILAPDAVTALQEMENYDIAAVIAGASKTHPAGLGVLAAAKQKTAGIKTLAVTSLGEPELPLQAYEMDLDDYLHWPLNGPALSARLRYLLGLGPDPTYAGSAPGELAEDSGPTQTLAILSFLVDRFTESLAEISQSLEDIRQAHRQDMATELSTDLLALAADIKYLSNKMRQVWQCQTQEAAAPPPDRKRCFH